MPLSAALSSLEQGIKTAYTNCKNSGEADGADPNSIISQLAQELSDSIHQYMTSALVTTTVTVDSGQPDSVGGATTVPGSGAGTGNLS